MGKHLIYDKQVILVYPARSNFFLSYINGKIVPLKKKWGELSVISIWARG
jgi:hypothetical protein